ncbi:MAG: bacteriocin family protein [Actinomycetota bacterium]|nr:bacteriocin family protein [Actinomycetota bacterium]
MTDHLLRGYAPIPATGWRQIDEEAKTLYLEESFSFCVTEPDAAVVLTDG